MITKKAIDKNNYFRDLEFTNTAREGWELILKTLKSNSKILLPSYIGITEREGSGIFDPVVDTGVSYDFYMLNEDLSISISEIENRLKEGGFDLILLVHYFGFKIENIKEVIEVCKKYTVIVVEDCAHLYNYNQSNKYDVGTCCDFAFYSLHKFFPFNKGGLFIQNNLDKKKPDVSQLSLEENYSQKIVSYNIYEIVKKRIQNFKEYDKLIVNIRGLKKIKKLKIGDIPNNFPILIENGLREELYFWLIKKDVTLIALYYNLIEPLRSNRYASMQKLSSNILNLPVHQDVDKKEIKHIVDLIKEGLLKISE